MSEGTDIQDAAAGVKRSRKQCAFVYAYLSQGEVWFPNGKPAVQISDMDETWRFNSSRLLERGAKALELRYSLGMFTSLAERTFRSVVGEVDGVPVEHGPLLSELDLMSDHVQDSLNREMTWAGEHPEEWLKTTALYKALVAGLPTTPKKLAKLAERARHWSACPCRTKPSAACTCPTGNPEMCRACYAAGEQCDGCSAADDATWD